MSNRGYPHAAELTPDFRVPRQHARDALVRRRGDEGYLLTEGRVFPTRVRHIRRGAIPHRYLLTVRNRVCAVLKHQNAGGSSRRRRNLARGKRGGDKLQGRARARRARARRAAKGTPHIRSKVPRGEEQLLPSTRARFLGKNRQNSPRLHELEHVVSLFPAYVVPSGRVRFPGGV